MPTYEYRCAACYVQYEEARKLADYKNGRCRKCGGPLELVMPAVPTKIAGRVLQGGGPDRFTADALGIPLKELPEGLKA